MKKLLATLVVVMGCGSAGDPQAEGLSASDASLRELTPVLVGFRSGIDTASIRAAGGHVRSEWAHLGAVSAQLPRGAITALANNPNVEYVEADRTVHALGTSSSEDTWGNVAVAAPDVRALGVTGTGITVCVIDTGVDPLHPEFSRTPAVFGAGYDFVDGDSDPTDYGCDTTGCHWGEGHGTHVTGTIVAQLGNGGIVGVAPGVTVVEYRVLGLDGSGTTTAVINGINACAQLPGLRIASLSLGSTQKSRTEQKAFDAAYAAGVLIYAAAGNDGNTKLSYPAGYASVVSVAAVDSNLAHASFSQYNRDVEVAAPGVGVLSSVPRGQGLASSVTVGGTAYASNPVEYSPVSSASGTLVNCGICDSTSSCGGAGAGFVAYCDRGTIAFADKVTNAMAQGAAAVIIANNDITMPDDAGSFTLGAAGNWVPTASVSYNSGLVIKASGIGSSSTVALAASDYATWDGTSMATPHASACAALAWSAKPGLTAAQVRDLINGTATDLGDPGRDNLFGYGLVNCLAAVQAP